MLSELFESVCCFCVLVPFRGFEKEAQLSTTTFFFFFHLLLLLLSSSSPTYFYCYFLLLTLSGLLAPVFVQSWRTGCDLLALSYFYSVAPRSQLPIPIRAHSLGGSDSGSDSWSRSRSRSRSSSSETIVWCWFQQYW